MRHPYPWGLPVLWLTGLMIVVAGCASSGGGGSSGSRNVLTVEDLAPYAEEGLRTYDAVRRLRPRWLQSRGGAPPRVMVDGIQGDLQMPVAEVERVTYLSPADATTRFGTGFPRGAIVVERRAR